MPIQINRIVRQFQVQNLMFSHLNLALPKCALRASAIYLVVEIYPLLFIFLHAAIF